MVAAAGGAPAVTTRMPERTPRRSSWGALARESRIVGAADSAVTRSRLTFSNTARDSTFRRQTWAAPTAVTVHTKVHPLAWNIAGSTDNGPRLSCGSG